MNIYKYTLEIADYQILKLPANSLILSVLNQREALVLYAVVNPEEETYINRTIRIIGTGHSVGDDIDKFNFLGTISMEGGALIWHVFWK